MNAERLHIIAKSIRQDLTKTNQHQVLQNIITSLQNRINQPQQPQYDQEVSQHLTTLYQSLDTATSNDFSPTWKQLIDEIEATDILGLRLKERIEGIFSRNQITQAVALQELQEINNKIQNLQTALDQIISSFQLLKIGAEELEPGECEVGVLVPRDFVGNSLDRFADELEEIDRIFETFSELVTGSRSSFQIRTISSSDLTIYFDAIPQVAACIAVAVERIVELYKKLLEIRKLHGELSKQGIPENNLDGIKTHANSLMETGIEKLIPELIKDFYSNSDEGRKNELTIELRFSLKKIANRIDNGFNIEVRAEPDIEEKQSESNDATHQDAQKYYSIIETTSRTMQFIKREGSPILSLPESADDGSKNPKK